MAPSLSLGLSRPAQIMDLSHIQGVFRSHRAASIAALSAAIVIPWAIRDYLTFLSYGPGGLPYNVGGWLVTHVFRLFAHEQLSTTPYTDTRLHLASEPGFLPPECPPQRGSERPKLGPHPVPQRQLSQLPVEEMREKLIAQFAELGKLAETHGLVEIRKSQLERQHDAFFVSKSREWHPVAQQMRGEITHVHAGLDGSIHVVLHPADSQKVIERGWGQRHGFAGVNAMKRIAGFSLPVTYLLIYAPRDEQELSIALAIVKASIGYMTGTRDILD